MEPTAEEIAAASAEPPRKVGRNGDLQQKVSYLPDIHRLLPQAPDAERGVLSSFLLAPSEIGGMCTERGIYAPHFHLPAHALIFDELRNLWDEHEPIDFITLTQRLRDQGKLDQAGGAAFVTELFTFLPTAANAGYYIEIIEEKYTLREIIKVCTEYAARSYDEQDDVHNLLNDVESKILAIASHRARGSQQISARAAADEAMEGIRWRIRNPGKIRGLTTGFRSLDLKTDGLHRQEWIVLASRPSDGKTALAMQISEHIAFDLRLPVAFYSLEMSRPQLLERWIYMRAKISAFDILDGGSDPAKLEPKERRLEAAARELAAAPIHIEDSDGMTIQQLRASARRLKRQHNVAAIFVDSGSALKSSSRQAQAKREWEVADISRGLKAMAKELDVPVVTLWHLGRQTDNKTADETPKLSDLRGGATVEQDADVVAMLLPQWQEGPEMPAQIYFPKQRCAPRHARVDMAFIKRLTSFREIGDEPIQEEMSI